MRSGTYTHEDAPTRHQQWALDAHKAKINTILKDGTITFYCTRGTLWRVVPNGQVKKAAEHVHGQDA